MCSPTFTRRYALATHDWLACTCQHVDCHVTSRFCDSQYVYNICLLDHQWTRSSVCHRTKRKHITKERACASRSPSKQITVKTESINRGIMSVTVPTTDHATTTDINLLAYAFVFAGSVRCTYQVKRGLGLFAEVRMRILTKFRNAHPCFYAIFLQVWQPSG